MNRSEGAVRKTRRPAKYRAGQSVPEPRAEGEGEMKSRSAGNTPPDPFKIFMNAERADVLLRSFQDPQIAVAVANPALVLSAFASELYLKSILVIEKGKAPGWHHLKNLFDLVSPVIRKKIERHWIHHVSSQRTKRTFAAIALLTGQDVPTDFNWALSVGAQAFVKLRYVHEDDGFETKFLLGELPDMLRQVIVDELKPAWAPMIHGPMQPIPGFENPI